MYYQFYEWNHAFLSPARALNDAVRLYYRNPLNPLTHTEFGRQIAAAGDLFERMTRHYGKPEFGITETVVNGKPVAVSEEVVWERPFCRLLHFVRELPPGTPPQPKVVLVAPMSGHYATLLRGTVQALLPYNDVYITDWADARKVPLTVGRFDLDDFITYIIDIIQYFGGDAHLVAVCQPAVPVFAATAVLERRNSPVLPKSITLMGGPIDTRQNPTEVNTYAEKHDLDWFRRNVVMVVPFPHPGVMRRVYPGFLQLTGFMTMNLDRHLTAHYDYFDNLVKGDGDSADKHRDFYDEYLSVMDLTAEFYLQTVDTVFLRHSLPKGEMIYRSEPVDPKAITKTPILTIEGEKDDISGLGQTKAAHALTPNLPVERHSHYEQAGVGHYGVFNGSRFRNEITPRICAFIAAWNDGAPPEEARPAPRLVSEAKPATAAPAEQPAPALKAVETALAPVPVAKAGAASPALNKAQASPKAAPEPQPAASAKAAPEASPKPQASTAPQATATPEPKAAAKPATAQAKPAKGEVTPTEAAKTEAKPAAAKAESAVAKAEPTGEAAQADPAAAKAEPAAIKAESEAATAESTSVKAENEAATAESTSVKAENEAAAAEPTSVKAENEAAAAEPTAVKAENEAAAAEPTAVRAENEAAAAEPTAVKVESEPAKAEPAAAKAETGTAEAAVASTAKTETATPAKAPAQVKAAETVETKTEGAAAQVKPAAPVEAEAKSPADTPETPAKAGATPPATGAEADDKPAGHVREQRASAPPKVASRVPQKGSPRPAGKAAKAGPAKPHVTNGKVVDPAPSRTPAKAKDAEPSTPKAVPVRPATTASASETGEKAPKRPNPRGGRNNSRGKPTPKG